MVNIALTIDGNTGVDPSADDQARRYFRNTLGHFATGVTAMTAVSADGKDIGLTVSSFNSLSLDPPLILWSIAATSMYYDSFQVGTSFAVNVLSETQEHLALKFGRPGDDKFEGVCVHRGLSRVLLLDGCVAYLECITEARYPGGDHDIVVGRVLRIFNIGKSPLLFHAGTLRAFGDKLA